MSSETIAARPDCCPDLLRRRSEEAVSASIHHAALAQQYLTLAQKFTALAEHVAGGVDGLQQVAVQLEREACSPDAAPAVVPPVRMPPQSPPANSGPRQIFPPITQPPITQPPISQSLTGQPAASQVPTPQAPTTRQVPAEFHAPPARVPLQELSQAEQQVRGAVTQHGVQPGGQPGGQPGRQPREKSLPKPAMRRVQRRFSLRSFLERVRLAGTEQAGRVRVTAHAADLRPRLRKASEELVESLRQGRRPASISSVITSLAVLLMALGRMEFTEELPLPPLSASFSGSEDAEDPAEVLDMPLEMPGEQQLQPTDQPAETPPPELAETVPPPDSLPEPEVDLQVPESEEPAAEPVAEAPALPESPVGTAPAVSKSAGAALAESRSGAARQQMLMKYGGTAGSESAVSRALEWLAGRQRPDGSWDFADVGPCSSPGKISNPIGGTAYALLPFLAAGNTHKVGQWKLQVQAGLQYLTRVGISVPAGYDLRGVLNQRDDDPEPNYAYYVQGAAVLALCEAYGMTGDRQLRPVCEAAVRFLVNSQDPRGGGWRYVPQQAGSTSCTAIQVMALKAAEKAGIAIPDAVWRGVGLYLDSVAVDGEGRYGYEVQKRTYEGSVTAMALLSRMYLGCQRDEKDLRKGVMLLDKKGPYDNLYYCYFATQVLRNWGGEPWERWNGRLRDDLVSWQEQSGDAAGSWAPRDRSDYSVSGGRLLTTCLATLTLEVYYRYQPLLAEELVITIE